MIVDRPDLVATLLSVWRSRFGWSPPLHPREHDLYLFAVRATSDVVGPWDDALGALVGRGGGYELHLWRGTVDSGREGTGRGMNPGGVACLVPGRYPLCWTRGLHHGRRALVQRAPGVFRVFRDRDVNGRLVRGGKVYSDAAGINAHGPGRTVLGAVQGYSLGCVVTHTEADHADRMRLADAQADAGLGDRYSFVLADAGDDAALGAVLGAANL